MNNDELELRKRQLARLKGEQPVDELPTESTPKEYVPDPEVLARHNIQPENEVEPQPFVVGWGRNEYGDMLALPSPSWPNPGEPKTPEISRIHSAEGQLVDDANRSLTDCVRWLAGKLRDPESWEHEFSGPPSKLYETAWSFLMGTWRGRGIEIPSELQMQRWAKDYMAITNRRAAAKGVACKDDSKSPSD
jgi:hypothetical protein